MPLPNLPIDSIVNSYKFSMDWLANATSRQIIVFVEPHKSGCPNHVGFDAITQHGTPTYNLANSFSTTASTTIPFLDVSGILNVPFSGGMRCPVCDNKGFILGPVSGTASARIQWRNEMTKFDLDKIKLKAANFKVRIKVTGSSDLNLIDRSIRVVIDNQPCKIIMEKIPVGLRDIHSYYYYLDNIQ